MCSSLFPWFLLLKVLLSVIAETAYTQGQFCLIIQCLRYCKSCYFSGIFNGHNKFVSVTFQSFVFCEVHKTKLGKISDNKRTLKASGNKHFRNDNAVFS